MICLSKEIPENPLNVNFYLRKYAFQTLSSAFRVLKYFHILYETLTYYSMTLLSVDYCRPNISECYLHIILF